jgi:hypothetical protein
LQVDHLYSQLTPGWPYLEGDEPVFWLEAHLNSFFNISLLNYNSWPDSIQDMYVFHVTKKVMQNTFVRMLLRAGFLLFLSLIAGWLHKQVSFHWLRANFLSEAEALGGAEGLRRAALIAGHADVHARYARDYRTQAQAGYIANHLGKPGETQTAIVTSEVLFGGPCFSPAPRLNHRLNLQCLEQHLKVLLQEKNFSMTLFPPLKKILYNSASGKKTFKKAISSLSRKISQDQTALHVSKELAQKMVSEHWPHQEILDSLSPQPKYPAIPRRFHRPTVSKGSKIIKTRLAWTWREDALLYLAVKTFGCKWKQIARTCAFPHRSSDDLSEHWRTRKNKGRVPKELLESRIPLCKEDTGNSQETQDFLTACSGNCQQ